MRIYQDQRGGQALTYRPDGYTCKNQSQRINIARLRAAAAAMGYNPEQVEVLIGQMVNLLGDGKAERMSKRAPSTPMASTSSSVPRCSSKTVSCRMASAVSLQVCSPLPSHSAASR